MTEIDELLASAWTLDNLQVYGDHLQTIDDPRGELVAIDLHIAREGSSGELAHRRRRALRAWLGMEPGENPTRGLWLTTRFAYGFVDDVRVQMIERVLAGPAAPFVRGVTLTGKTPAIEAGLQVLSHAVRPWLARLTIAPRYKGDPPGRWWRSEPPNVVMPKGLIAATPRLERLDLLGHRLARDFVHPGVKQLRIAGIDALLSLLEPRDPMPAVTELMLAFAHEHDAPVVLPQPWPTLIPHASFPALARLDLSSNEDARATTDTQIGVFSTLANLGVLEQLQELRLPSIRNESEAHFVQTAIDRMPELRRIEILRSSGFPLQTRAEIRVVELSWPRIEWADGWIAVRFPNDRHPFLLGTRDAVRFCEQLFHDFDDEARAAWTALWQCWGGQQTEPLTGRAMQRLLESLGVFDPSRGGMGPWHLARERARIGSPEAEIGVTVVPR